MFATSQGQDALIQRLQNEIKVLKDTLKKSRTTIREQLPIRKEIKRKEKEIREYYKERKESSGGQRRTRVVVEELSEPISALPPAQLRDAVRSGAVYKPTQRVPYEFKRGEVLSKNRAKYVKGLVRRADARGDYLLNEEEREAEKYIGSITTSRKRGEKRQRKKLLKSLKPVIDKYAGGKFTKGGTATLITTDGRYVDLTQDKWVRKGYGTILGYRQFRKGIFDPFYQGRAEGRDTGRGLNEDVRDTMNKGMWNKVAETLYFKNVKERKQFKKQIKQFKQKKIQPPDFSTTIGKKGLFTESRLKEMWEVVDMGSQINPRWGTAYNRFMLNLSGDYSMGDIERGLRNMVNQAIRNQGLKPSDKIRIVIEDPRIQSFVSTSLTNVSLLNFKSLYDKLMEAVESNEDFIIDENTTFNINSIIMPSGSGNFNPDLTKLENFYQKKSVIRIINNDHMCLARAVVVSKYYKLYGRTSKEYQKIRKYRIDKKTGLHKDNNFQRKEAEQLCNDCGIDKNSPCGIPEIKLIEQYLGVEIVVYQTDICNEMIYPNTKNPDYEPLDSEKTYYLSLMKGHYDVIVSEHIAGFLGKNNFCQKCKTTYQNKEKHKCFFKCPLCCSFACYNQKDNQDKNEEWIECLECQAFFPNKSCFALHKTDRKYKDKKGKDKVEISKCERVFRCNICHTYYDKQIYDMKS